MESLNEYLNALVSKSGDVLCLEPNRQPYIVAAGSDSNIGEKPLAGAQITTMVYPVIPAEVRQVLLEQSEVDFVHPHNLKKFGFVVKKSPAGFVVTVRQIESVAAPDASERPSGSAPETTTHERAENADRPPLSDEETESAMAAAFAADDPSVEALEEITAAKKEAQASRTSKQRQKSMRGEMTVGVPDETNMSPLDRMQYLLCGMCEDFASHLHLVVDGPPMMRCDSELVSPAGASAMTAQEISDVIASVAPKDKKNLLAAASDFQFTYDVPGLARFRFKISTDNNGICCVIRRMPHEIPTTDDLEFPSVVTEFCASRSGLVIVAGSTGSGKAATVAAMIDLINKTRSERIITIEESIEFVHKSQSCLVSQFEIGTHVADLNDAMHAASIGDAGVVVIGEMNNAQAVSLALDAAEDGKLVFAAVTARTAISAIDRVIGYFDPEARPRQRARLARTLKGVLAPRSVEKIGGGRILAFEGVTNDAANTELIARGETENIAYAEREDGTPCTIDHSLIDLAVKKIISNRVAISSAIDRDFVEKSLSGSRKSR